MHKIEVVTAGIDWLSISMHESVGNYSQWRAKAYEQIEAIADEGHQVRPRTLLGYGGVSAGNCFFGEGVDTSFGQFTGSYAQEAYRALYDTNAHISRIDVQCTVKLAVMSKTLAKEAYRAAIDDNKTLPIGRRRKIWIIVGSDGGDTCYIGSPSSEQRGRIYNKEVQSELPEYTRTWRYEVVFRNDLATSFARECASTPYQHAEYCLGAVIRWFNSRGVDLEFLGDFLPVVLPLARTKPTDIEKKLAWLSSQVAPTIRYLISEGYRDTILLSLGLLDD